MSFSASAADERVLDVQLTEDTLTRQLTRRSRNFCASRLVSSPAQCHPLAAAQPEDRGRRLRHPLA